ncbi:type II RES/Xre toxin-antitoxin system antitoxin [Sphingobacterium wenxiniae]|uniref:Putative toxin-antitoxin system antitoxin component, TIGR02293 family n=1 Tax=Sphingobacterium wenxiniae TaxID=683125 RepID=A0A1I6QQ12_9SPHI|nr:antitoxin Xre/MbcA/ParS toxin-binding domain-containing protein [Sphingobacterium wenxiniae]SFS54530.1 putative toxin-antitoxin system antitoxin component, TIGR02293 family [Sphingobacterium wenxiniae]
MKSNKVKAYDTEVTPVGLVEEAPTAYYTGSRTIPLNLLTSVQKMDISKQGISKRYLESFKKEASLDYPTLADALSVTRATLINKKGNQKFNEQVSERIVSLADLYAFGYEVFESRELFNEWMSAPNHALGGIAPIHIMNSYYGREEVRNIIGRIAYGVYS